MIVHGCNDFLKSVDTKASVVRTVVFMKFFPPYIQLMIKITLPVVQWNFLPDNDIKMSLQAINFLLYY